MYSSALDKHGVMRPWSCAGSVVGPGIWKPVPKEDPLVETYEIYISHTTQHLPSVSCALYRFSLCR